jgi:DNA-binding transcriptional regulator YiaG
MINLNALKEAKSTKITFADVNKIVDKVLAKNLRNKLNVSQAVFATMMNVSKKTVEAWEAGTNPIKGGAAVAIYLLDKHIGLSRDLIRMEVPEDENPSFFPFAHANKYFLLPFDIEEAEYADNYSPTRYVIETKPKSLSCDNRQLGENLI